MAPETPYGAAVGWHPDPANPGAHRYWNGSEWAAPPPDWYPVPENPPYFAYWDGTRFLDGVKTRAQLDQMHGRGKFSPQTVSTVGGIAPAVAIVGVILASQSASLISGTGTIWLGAGLAVIAGVVARVFDIKTWAQVLCIIAALYSVGAAIRMESALEDRREEITRQFDQLAP
ncbi:DUF2510 domain-containing protein [Nocardioides sp.]|uniref:DUF2510 domain-containing protein n=1 Tax=Nocardioides sp. TaxID=35761 RepID=UPI00351727B0